MPIDVVSLFTSVCMSVMVAPDLFKEEPTKAVMAVARPAVPAFDCIIVPPPIIPPPIPPMEMEVEPIIPFIVPSDASFIIAVTIPDDDTVIPMVFAYWDMAATDMPWFLWAWVAPEAEPVIEGSIGEVMRMSPAMK
jgi:hypothetical protein